MKMKRNCPLATAFGIALAVVPLTSRAQDGGSDPYPALEKREFGTAVEELAAIEKLIQGAKPEDYPAIEARLIGVLEAPGATLPGRQFACQMLSLVGSPKCVPAVAKLLTDEQLSHMARTVLLGVKQASVDAVLCKALEETQGKVRIGIVNTIGDRADNGSLKALAELLKGGDEAVATAALNAIGKIGGEGAADVLDRANVPDPLKAAWAQAYLRCAGGLAAAGAAQRAQKMYRTLLDGDYPAQARAGAFGGIVREQKEQAVPAIVQMLGSTDRLLKRAALAAVIGVPGHAATVALAQQLPALQPDTRAALIGALAARGDAEGLSAKMNKYATDANQAIRESALAALGRLGDASSVPVLVAALQDATNGVIASRALVDLRGEGVVEGLVKEAEGGGGDVRVNVLGVLAERKQIEALAMARKIVNDGDAKIRQAALKVLAETGTLEDLKCLCDAILATRDNAECERQARAIAAIGVRLPDKATRSDCVIQAYEKAGDAAKIQLLAVFPAFGDPKALQTTVGALGRQGEVRKAAVRALAGWQDSAPLPELRKVAKEADDDAVRILALRGCIKMINPSRLKTEEKVQAFREAMELAKRPDERRQVLSEIGKVGHPESLKVVEPCLADDNLKREALQAYERIAESVSGREPVIAREALQKVLTMTNDEGLRDKARAALEKVK